MSSRLQAAIRWQQTAALSASVHAWPMPFPYAGRHWNHQAERAFAADRAARSTCRRQLMPHYAGVENAQPKTVSALGSFHSRKFPHSGIPEAGVEHPHAHREDLRPPPAVIMQHATTHVRNIQQSHATYNDGMQHTATACDLRTPPASAAYRATGRRPAHEWRPIVPRPTMYGISVRHASRSVCNRHGPTDEAVRIVGQVLRVLTHARMCARKLSRV